MELFLFMVIMIIAVVGCTLLRRRTPRLIRNANLVCGNTSVLNVYQTNKKTVVKVGGKKFTGKGKFEIVNGVVKIGGEVVGETEDDGNSITIG